MRRIMSIGFFILACYSSANANRHQIQLLLNSSERNIAEKFHLVPLEFMPGLYIGDISEDQHKSLVTLFTKRASVIAQSYEELDVSSASMQLKSIDGDKQTISNWWDAGFTGRKAVVAILDSGVPDNYVDSKGNVFVRQNGLENINMIVNRSKQSGFDKYLNGIRTPHGTSVAEVFAQEDNRFRGISYGVRNMLVTLAGDNTVDDTNWKLTLININWLLTTPGQLKPTVINYSYGNGNVYCSQTTQDCSNTEDWSSVAKVIDYVVNHYQISWVKSAGNRGWINPTSTAPYASTLTIPADSYNAIVVANMNNTIFKTDTTLQKSSDRSQHFIYYSSSRGPTLNGRRKPDLTAPGTDIRTDAPDENIYAVQENPTFKPYTTKMQYDPDMQTRLATGTSIATPHVGAAIALLYDSGINSPMSIKALLINSADTWTDGGQPDPKDPNNPCASSLPNCGHGQIMNSQWNRTYGWGYINMDAAYKQRLFVKTYSIKPHQTLCYEGNLKFGDKVTIVWERRVSLDENGHFWKLTPLHLVMRDENKIKILDEDNSKIDNVLQVANTSSDLQAIEVEVNIPDEINQIDGASQETFALASSDKLIKVAC